MADITPIASLNGELAMPEKVWMQGPPGPQGQQGEPGAAATVTVGTVTTGEPGTDAIVTNSGTESAAVFNFTIPRGETGTAGADGKDGAAATVTVGTVTTGEQGTDVIVTNSGTESAAVLNFTIPRGETGTAGAGVPDGGTVGQLLGKTETGTAWIDPPQSGVQPDWNQNDETAADYVKNRPFYSEIGIVTVENVADAELDGFPIFAVGDTVTVTVDGVEHSLVAYNDDGFTTIGDTSSSIDSGEGQLGWQFYVLSGSKKVNFYATEAHTVSYLSSVYHTIDAKYMPKNLATKSEVEVAQTKANAAQTKANAAQTTANAAQTTANAAQTTANAALERVVEPYTRNRQMAPLYKNGGFSAWRGVVQELSYDKTEGYFFANVFDTTALNGEDMPKDVFCAKVYVENQRATAFLSHSVTTGNYWHVSGFAVITNGYSRTGEILYVSSNEISTNSAKGLFLTFSAPSSMLLKSSTANSTKRFRITVDDSGTISATEVT